MEYLTTIEMSEKWNITPRRIAILCENAEGIREIWKITNIRQRFKLKGR